MNRATREVSGEHLVQVAADGATLEGNLGIPKGAHSVVLFAHGSGRASHLFEEPGKLEEVARLATAWFKQHLDSASAPGRRE